MPVAATAGICCRAHRVDRILAAVVLMLVPLTTEAGEWLEHRVPAGDLLHEHTELGDTAIFYALPLVLLAVALWWRHREEILSPRHAGRSWRPTRRQ